MISRQPSPTPISVSGHKVEREVLSAVKLASQRTGVDFGYLVAQAAQESGFKPDAKASTSSATGLYQFIDNTWLQVMRDYGSKHGLGEAAQKISTTPDGRPVVASAEDKRRILDMRHNPAIAALMAAEYARGNEAAIRRETGASSVGSTDLYLGHFLGPNGASKFLSAMKTSPDKAAAAVMPDAASSNRGVFFESTTGRPFSLREVYDRFDRKLSNVSAEARKVEGVGMDAGAAQPGQPRKLLPQRSFAEFTPEAQESVEHFLRRQRQMAMAVMAMTAMRNSFANLARVFSSGSDPSRPDSL